MLQTRPSITELFLNTYLHAGMQNGFHMTIIMGPKPSRSKIDSDDYRQLLSNQNHCYQAACRSDLQTTSPFTSRLLTITL